MAREDFAYIADQLSGAQRRRLIGLARAGKSLPWGRSDDALAAKGLVRRYGEPFGRDYADLTSAGLAMAQRIQKNAGPA